MIFPMKTSHPGGIPRQLSYSDVGLHEHSHDERCQFAGGVEKTSLVDDQKVGFQIHDIHGIRIVKHREIFESYLHCTLVDDDLMKPWVTTASLVPLGMIIVQSGNRQMPRGISA